MRLTTPIEEYLRQSEDWFTGWTPDHTGSAIVYTAIAVVAYLAIKHGFLK